MPLKNSEEIDEIATGSKNYLACLGLIIFSVLIGILIYYMWDSIVGGIF